MTLVERGKRPVRLTPAGERLHAHAATILGAARTAEADLRAVAGLEAGTLRIGAFLTACTSFVPAAIGAFAAEHPRVDVRLDQLEPDASLPRLIVGELDLAVVYHGRRLRAAGPAARRPQARPTIRTASRSTRATASRAGARCGSPT